MYAQVETLCVQISSVYMITDRNQYKYQHQKFFIVVNGSENLSVSMLEHTKYLAITI